MNWVRPQRTPGIVVPRDTSGDVGAAQVCGLGAAQVRGCRRWPTAWRVGLPDGAKLRYTLLATFHQTWRVCPSQLIAKPGKVRRVRERPHPECGLNVVLVNPEVDYRGADGFLCQFDGWLRSAGAFLELVGASCGKASPGGGASSVRAPRSVIVFALRPGALAELERQMRRGSSVSSKARAHLFRK